MNGGCYNEIYIYMTARWKAVFDKRPDRINNVMFSKGENIIFPRRVWGCIEECVRLIGFVELNSLYSGGIAF